METSITTPFKWKIYYGDFSSISNKESSVWYSSEIFGLWDYLDSPGQKRVLFGRSIEDEDYQKILNFTMNDLSIPTKTGWPAHEKSYYEKNQNSKSLNLNST
jgi:hypothetical protein